MRGDYSSRQPFKEKAGTIAVVALLASILAAGSISCPAHLDDVNVREAIASGIDYSFVVWKIDIPRHLLVGEKFQIPITLLNNGNEPWSSSAGSRYFLSYHLKYFTEGYDTSDMFRGARSPLPLYVGSGELVEMELTIEPPQKQGAYYIAVDIGRAPAGEEDSVFWFSREGWRTTDYLVEVESR